ncbi:SLAC1 anion channel family protein [Ectothiorhodospira sp. BSL-9]|uniref:SLAC1 anion channel family protein n=1 Tax=Ectothiorhodospira sp. BSL-9 TaxID=1442136 RepID=UPI0007B44B4D|nr:SLAC1 anion channel family protein [Ectothiorhodospira sp. BSL-9]ANB02765.1 C4-dicarboxylate ABC transporter [Ectothiorhodospira sp. BSL-9]
MESPSSQTTEAPGPSHWLMHVPIPLFAMVMGITGLGLAWRKAHEVLGLPAIIGEGLLILGAAIFVSITLLYLTKAMRHFGEVVAEFRHPIRVNFFPTFSISLLLLGIAALDHWPALSLVLWAVGTTLHFMATVYLLGRWITQSHEINMINPAWFIPVVGNLLVPVGGVPLGFVETSWFFFSIGMIFWIILFTIVFYRIVFHNPLPAKFLPTLFILIAPPAVGMIGYMGLMGHEVDMLVRMLVYVGLFITVLNVSLTPQFLKVPFFVSWWAYTFPLAAMSIATLTYLDAMRGIGLTLVAGAVLTLTTFVILAVLVRTTMALVTGKLFVPD